VTQVTDNNGAAPVNDLDVIVVGAGFSGLYALHRMRALGFSVRVLERGSGVGGTWFWNRYPGARCDIESVDYCYSFSEGLIDEWQWSERYAAQPEILAYLNHVADRFDLRRDIQLDTDVSAARFDDGSNRWVLDTEQGERFACRWCVMGTGDLSSIKRPDFPGLDEFEGDWLHTAQWPREGVDFAGRRVAVIGTGSTAIQAIPQIAAQAEQLYVFQRTPNYSMPAQNRPLEREELEQIRRNYSERRRIAERSEAGVPFPPPERGAFEVTPAERQRLYEEGWRRGGINALSYAFTDYFTSHAANSTAAEFTRERIREIVREPDLAESLCPYQHIGTKRTCVDIAYFETYNRENVRLIDLRREPLLEITKRGIRTEAAEYEVDCIVFAIGFDAMTGALLDIDIRGSGGRSLREHWAAGPRTYLGLSIAGFPNMFVVTGPGSPSVLSNMVVSIEQHVDWISDFITAMRDGGVGRAEATAEAEERWVRHVGEVADATLYPLANSWYVGANIPGKPRVCMPYVGGCGRYREECDEVARRGYEGFTLVAGAAAPDSRERAPA
jgi:cation diffusion facilitator CzcD-associated flavoprotein CzcO